LTDESWLEHCEGAEEPRVDVEDCAHVHDPVAVVWGGEELDESLGLAEGELKIFRRNSFVSIIWSPSGLHSLLDIPKGEHCNSRLVANIVVPHVQTNFCSGTRRKRRKCWTVHLDNAPAHNSKRSQETLEATGTIRMPHYAYSPDLVPRDFCLFGNLKEKLQSVAVTD
jgi:hypothetical protein